MEEATDLVAHHKILEIMLLNLFDTKPESSNPHPSLAESSQDSSRGEENTKCCSARKKEVALSRSNNDNEFVFGYMSMLGQRREMEDVITVAPIILDEEKYSFFAVYDGHGRSKVAEMCGEMMHKIVEKHVRKAKLEADGLHWEKVMTKCVSSMDEELQPVCDTQESVETKCMGSTVALVLVGKEEIVVANCGDSRAVLSRDGVVVPLTTDHKPDRADERERIEAAGGLILNWYGWRVEGVLSTSRSLGDVYLKPYVSSVPEVTVLRRSEHDDFIIIGTDGLFDVICNELACKFVQRCLSRQLRRGESKKRRVTKAAARVAELAATKGSTDNISVIIVQMK